MISEIVLSYFGGNRSQYILRIVLQFNCVFTSGEMCRVIFCHSLSWIGKSGVCSNIGGARLLSALDCTFFFD